MEYEMDKKCEIGALALLITVIVNKDKIDKSKPFDPNELIDDFCKIKKFIEDES